jgi:phage tail-like protein
MADERKDFLSQARFEFKLDDEKLNELYVESVSGLKLTIPVTQSDGPVGVKGKGTVVRQAAPSAVESQNVTVTFITSSDKPKAVSSWFYDSHSTPDAGGATGTKGVTKTATLTVFTQGASEGAQWEFKDVMPLSYEMSALDVGGNDSLKETVTFCYSYMLRKK